MLFGFLVFILLIICILLCFLILIQSDKGGGISGAIGGGLGGANSLLGTQDTANILTKGTTIFGSAFLVLCVILSFVASNQGANVQKSMLQKRAEKQQSYSPSSILENKGLPMQQGTPETAPGTGNPAQQQNAPALPPAGQPQDSK